MHSAFDFRAAASPFHSPATLYDYELCPPPFLSAGAQLSNYSLQPANYKTRVCRHFKAGKCRLGNLCNFAHGDDEAQFYIQQEKVRKNSDSKVPRQQNFSNGSSNPEPLREQCAKKVAYAEAQLEAFYQQQKMLLERLKFQLLTAPFGCSPVLSKEQAFSVDTQLNEFYNHSVNFTDLLHKTLEIEMPLDSIQPINCGPALNFSHLSSKNTESMSVSSKPYGKNSWELNDEENKEELPQNDNEDSDSEDEEKMSVRFQMIFILERLKELHGNRIAEKLECARSQLSSGRLVEAAQQLQSVLYEPGLPTELQRSHKAIVEEAKVYFNS